MSFVSDYAAILIVMLFCFVIFLSLFIFFVNNTKKDATEGEMFATFFCFVACVYIIIINFNLTVDVLFQQKEETIITVQDLDFHSSKYIESTTIITSENEEFYVNRITDYFEEGKKYKVLFYNTTKKISFSTLVE